MKFLTTLFLAGFLASGAACAKEEPKKVDSQITDSVTSKKPATPAAAPAPETKKVCVDVQGKDGKPVIDPKTKKPKQQCVTVKVRQKFEGTKVPEKK